MKSIFVSSTFRDMQAERDMLHMEVMPKLQEKANTYGERVSFIDLRWGVNTGDMDSESGAKKVLSVCMDEIDRSRPYMLVFLGERYGWIPDAKLIEQAISQKNFLVEEIEESVTALEIEYGALSRMGSAERCIFCIREPLPHDKMPRKIRKDYEAESPLHKQKLDALKKRIHQLPNAQMITYRGEWQKGKVVGLEALSQQIYESLVNMFESEWEDNQNLTWQDRELMEFELVMEEKRSGFVGREALLYHYMSQINNTDNERLRQELRNALSEVGQEFLPDYQIAISNIIDNKAFILQGKQGSGKSSVLSMLAEKLKNQNDVVYSFICGHSGKSDQLIEMIKQMVYFLEKQLDMPHVEGINKSEKEPSVKQSMTNGKWHERFAELCDQYGKTKENRIAFVLDGLEQLKREEMVGKLNWLPPFLPQNMVFVMSVNEEMDTSLFAGKESFCVEKLELLQESEKKDIIGGILSANRKGLNDSIVRALMNKASSNNPMYLNMLLTRLMMMDQEDFLEADRLGGGGDGLDARMIAIIEQAPESLEEMGAYLLKEAARKCSPNQAKETLYLLATSRRGLREEDLEILVRNSKKAWNAVDFSRLLRYMRDYFIIRGDGRIDFKYSVIRQGLIKTLSYKIKKYQKEIFKHIQSLPVEDALRISEGLYAAKSVDYKQFALSYIYEMTSQPYEIKERGAQAIRELIANEGSAWLADVCKLSPKLDNPFAEYEFYNYLINYAFVQSVWGWYDGKYINVSAVVFEDIRDRVLDLGDKFDIIFGFELSNLSEAMVLVDAYIDAFLLGIKVLWKLAQDAIEYNLHQIAITKLNALIYYIEKTKDIIIAKCEETIQDIEEWKIKWDIKEDSEAHDDVDDWKDSINHQRDLLLYYDVKSNLCRGQLLIKAGKYEEALKDIQQAEHVNDDMRQWFENSKDKIAIDEAYYEIKIATEGIHEDNKDELEEGLEDIMNQYEKVYEKNKTIKAQDENDMFFWLRDGLIKQANCRRMLQSSEGVEYCERALDMAEQALKRANTPQNGVEYSNALFLMGVYWQDNSEQDKANDYFKKAYSLMLKYESQANAYVSQCVLDEAHILTVMFHVVGDIETIDKTNEEEMRLLKESIDASWKESCHYIEAALKYPEGFSVNQKQLHALLKGANAVAYALNKIGLIEDSLFYCEEAIRYWKKCESPIYPVTMMGETVYDLYTQQANLLDELGKPEESIDVFKEILSFDKVTEIESAETLAWVLEKREAVIKEFTWMFVEDDLYDELDGDLGDKLVDELDDKTDDEEFCAEDIYFAFDEQNNEPKRVIEKYIKLALANAYAGLYQAEFYFDRAVKLSEEWNESEKSLESFERVKDSYGIMARWYESDEKIEKAILYFEKMLECCVRLYEMDSEKQELEQLYSVMKKLHELYRNTGNEKRAKLYDEMELKWKK